MMIRISLVFCSEKLIRLLGQSVTHTISLQRVRQVGKTQQQSTSQVVEYCCFRNKYYIDLANQRI